MMDTSRIRNRESGIGKTKRGTPWTVPDSCFVIRASRPGFTLLEMLVSIGIFAVVIIASVGLLLSISEAQQKASNVQNIQDNIRFTLELITKELRQGNAYAGGGCSGDSCTAITFTNKQGQNTGYCLSGGVIRRFSTIIPCADGSALTGGNVSISRLIFYIVGEQSGPSDGQPRVTVVVSGQSASSQVELESSLNLQTTVTQRIRDL